MNLILAQDFWGPFLANCLYGMLSTLSRHAHFETDTPTSGKTKLTKLYIIFLFNFRAFARATFVACRNSFEHPILF